MEKPLKDAYPRLYFLIFEHNITDAEALQKGLQGFKFRRTLYAETSELWNNLNVRRWRWELAGILLNGL